MEDQKSWLATFGERSRQSVHWDGSDSIRFFGAPDPALVQGGLALRSSGRENCMAPLISSARL